MARRNKWLHGERKAMKRLAFVIVGTAALTLAACNRNNEDAVQNAELNQPNAELNAIADQAAMDAANAEAAARANQQNLLNAENAAAQDNVVNPREADEQNVAGM
jgi:predicted oxidoreductase